MLFANVLIVVAVCVGFASTECSLRRFVARCTYWEEPGAYGNERWLEVTVINEHNRTLETLSKAYFKNIPNLKWLLIDGYIHGIETGAFGAISQLYFLQLQNNHIEHLQPYMFVDVNAEIILVLQCQVKKISSKCFQHATNLKKLIIENNPLRVISELAFASLTVEKLLLPNNEISVVEENAFTNTSLREIDLSGNLLSDFQFLRFNSKVEKINLQNNRLVRISKRMLTGMTNLKSITLTDNQIGEIEEGSFDDAQKIHSLYLSGNQLEELSPALVPAQGLPQLASLDIRYNRLTYVPQELLRRLHLQRICTGGNPLTCACYMELHRWMHSADVNCGHDRIMFMNGQRPVCIMTNDENATCVEPRADYQTRQLVQDYLNTLEEYGSSFSG